MIYYYFLCVLPSAGELLSTQLITHLICSDTVAKQPPIPVAIRLVIICLCVSYLDSPQIKAIYFRRIKTFVLYNDHLKLKTISHFVTNIFRIKTI